MKNINLALDNCVSKKATNELSQLGLKVVFRATNERDEVWVDRAIYKGANVFISTDLDIPNILEKYYEHTLWIGLPQRLKSNKQSKYIYKKIKERLK